MRNSNEITEELIKSKAKYRSIVQASIAKWVKDFQEGRIKIATVDDLKKLIDMDIQILKDDINSVKNAEDQELRRSRKK